MSDSDERFEYPSNVRKRLAAARDKLQYAPFGIVTEVAKEVGVKRQYAHSVIFDDDTFNKYRSEKAQKIWWCLEKKVSEDKTIPIIEQVVKSLRNPFPDTRIELKMSSRQFAFLKRRLNRLKVAHLVDTDHGTPATYTFTPCNTQALAAA